MPYSACLIDVYETVLSVDYQGHAAGISAEAGVELHELAVAFVDLGPRVTDGRMTMAEAFAEVLRRSGIEPDDEAVDRLLGCDHALLRKHTTLHPDTVPFLESLRERGIRTAFVSNCGESTGPLLDDLGLTALVDERVLSCEVGAAKPAPAIFEAALTALDLPAESCLFVDDQPAFCEAAGDLGIHAVQISRREPANGTISSLSELADRF